MIIWNNLKFPARSKIPNQAGDEEVTLMKGDMKIDDNLGEYVNEMLSFKSRPKRPRNRRVDMRRKEIQLMDYSAGWKMDNSRKRELNFNKLSQIISAEGDKIEKDSTDEELPVEDSDPATSQSLETIENHNEDEIVCDAELRARLSMQVLPISVDIWLHSQSRLYAGNLRKARTEMRNRRRWSYVDPQLQSMNLSTISPLGVTR